MDQVSSQVILIFVSSTALILLISFLAALLLVMHQKRMVTQEMRVKELENDKQRDLLNATIEGQERERKRIAKDLHDGFGSLFSALRFNVMHWQSMANVDPSQKALLQDTFGLLENGIATVRTISHNLLPATLEEFGLVKAMEETIRPFQELGELTISMELTGQALRFDTASELGVLRVVQELIQNTLKHAHANAIEIKLHFTTDLLQMTYSDNGKGCDIHSLQPGLGIKNIRSRMLATQGTFHIQSEPGSGFHALLKLPLQTQTQRS